MLDNEHGENSILKHTLIMVHEFIKESIGYFNGITLAVL
jgi:hypothetical protein